jgi:hypothetical protein
MAAKWTSPDSGQTQNPMATGMIQWIDLGLEVVLVADQ